MNHKRLSRLSVGENIWLPLAVLGVCLLGITIAAYVIKPLISDDDGCASNNSSSCMQHKDLQAELEGASSESTSTTYPPPQSIPVTIPATGPAVPAGPVPSKPSELNSVNQKLVTQWLGPDPAAFACYQAMILVEGKRIYISLLEGDEDVRLETARIDLYGNGTFADLDPATWDTIFEYDEAGEYLVTIVATGSEYVTVGDTRVRNGHSSAWIDFTDLVIARCVVEIK